MDLAFEWDEEKNYINQMKHGVSFEDAREVFYDPRKFEQYDYGHSSTEERLRAYGFAGERLLMVSFTERNGIIRIISARKANRKEEEEYFKWVW